MTQPRFARQRSGREYLWPFLPPHELAVPSTTTITGKGVPKDALQFWAAKCVAECAYDRRRAWTNMDRGEAIDYLKRAPFRQRDKKAEVGDAVHSAIEAYLGNESELPLEKIERGYFEGALAFLVDNEVEVERAEATVFSRRHGYAGTADLFFRFGGDGSDLGRLVGDWKTAKAVYDETALQLVASARADFIADPDGVTEHAIPGDIEYGVTIRLTPDGGYEAVPFHLTDELFDIFLAAKVVAGRETVFRTIRQLPIAPRHQQAVKSEREEAREHKRKLKQTMIPTDMTDIDGNPIMFSVESEAA